MKTILIPTDFSDNAWNALFTALKLFYEQQCRFLLLHSYELDLPNLVGDQGERPMGKIYESLEEASKAKMKEILEYLDEHHKNPRHEFLTIVRYGDLLSQVRKCLKKDSVDMIIMGTQGATGAERILLGSNTVRILRHIRNKPVLAVPESFDFQRLHHVVFPTDYLHYYEPFELQPLIDLVREWKATLHVAYVAREFKLNPTQESNRKLLETRLTGLDVRYAEIPLEKHVAESIVGYGDSIRTDLLALMQHKHGFFENLTREKVVKRIALDSHVPLLILPQFL
ncbi:MAG: universal stress protein [Robiginitalea sp.]|jgi:nucleotide-binding universal stress UspA family protein